jgi:hypothetical protein
MIALAREMIPAIEAGRVSAPSLMEALKTHKISEAIKQSNVIIQQRTPELQKLAREMDEAKFKVSFTFPHLQYVSSFFVFDQ